MHLGTVMLACVITVSHLPNPLGASVHMHIDQVLVRDRCNRTVRAPNPALTGACSNQPNPGDPIPSSSPAHAHVSRRWLPDCFRLEGGSLVGGPYDRPIIRHARQEPSGEACRIVGHVLDGRSSPRTEHLILDRPGRPSAGIGWGGVVAGDAALVPFPTKISVQASRGLACNPGGG